jgi:hypothetical protein
MKRRDFLEVNGFAAVEMSTGKLLFEQGESMRFEI